MTAGPRHPGQTIPRPGTDNPADHRFYERAEGYLEEMMRLNPSVATYAGYHKYDGMMDDLSESGIATKVAFYKEARRRLEAVDRDALSVGAAIDLDLIRTDIESSLFWLEELKPHENDPQVYNTIIGYGTLYLTILEPGAPEWPERLEALLSRIQALPDFLAAARANLDNPARVLTNFIIEQNPGNITFLEKVVPPLFDNCPSLRGRLEATLPGAVAALREYQSFLENDLRPRSNGEWRLGKEMWSRKLRLTLQSDLTPEQIVEKAEGHLRETRREMLELARPMHDTMFPGHRHEETGEDLVSAVVDEVVSEISKRHSTPDRLLADCRRWVEKIKAFIRKIDYLELPPGDDNFVIEPTPSFLDGMAVAFFNPAPAFDPHLKKSYWISSIPKTGDETADARRAASYLREYNDYGLQSLTIHEAFPGHYVQFHYALKSPIASIYKKVFASGTFAEGWAVHCEEQMFELGYAADEPEALLIHKKMNLRSSINAILDARLHTDAIDEEKADRWALDLMQRHGFQEEAEAVGKLRRAKVSSTQLSTYFVGWMELAELQDQYRKLKGVAFSYKEFNEKLLSYGTIPPRAVRSLMLQES